jgi:ribosomal protein S12 methylthiotransferase
MKPAVIPSGKTVRMISLGCSKNLVDSEVMLGLLRERGWAPTPGEEADVVIINTCSFIREAQEESIETILSAAAIKEKGLGRFLVVTGCLPQRYGEDLLRELPEVDLFVGTGEFHRIGELLEDAFQGKLNQKHFIGPPVYLYDHETPRLVTSSPGSIYIKIAEGCSNFCSYCVIPKIRGRLRSRQISSILREAEQAVSRGVKEINLIAQDVTAYGQDLDGRSSLVFLLRNLAAIGGLKWIRLLYAHPGHISPDLIRVIREEEKICKYLDLPLQHIDDHLLKAMNRPVSSKEIYQLIEKLRREIPGIILRTSLLVGFPGETDRRFKTLYDFVREIQFERLGVFQYSPEEGTVASALKSQIPERVKAERYHQIMQLQKQISLRQQKRLIGSRVVSLIERVGSDSSWEGRTQGQGPEVDGMIFLGPGDFKAGMMVEAEVKEATSYDLYGKIIGLAP